jgi:chaperone required for assembly of F1-ATPase
LARGRLAIEEAWTAAHVDEDWQMTQWGTDETAMTRRAARLREFEAAALILVDTRSQG